VLTEDFSKETSMELSFHTKGMICAVIKEKRKDEFPRKNILCEGQVMEWRGMENRSFAGEVSPCQRTVQCMTQSKA
jgi:hypothetical protein